MAGSEQCSLVTSKNKKQTLGRASGLERRDAWARGLGWWTLLDREQGRARGKWREARRYPKVLISRRELCCAAWRLDREKKRPWAEGTLRVFLGGNFAVQAGSK